MRRLWPWLAALLPAAIAWGLAALMQSGRLPDPLLSVQADLGTLILLAGLMLSGLAVWTLAWQERARRQRDQAVADQQIEAAAAHRRFVQRLDHELKNPLTAMRAGLANLASEGPALDHRGTLDSVAVQTERLARLAADLRKLAELEVQTLERQPVDIASLLQEATELARQLTAAAERVLTLTLPRAPWPLPAVLGDRDLLFLAVYNLLDNALKFTHPGDTIEVRGFDDGAVVVIEVADTGQGIPPEELPHVFEELYRGQSARGSAGSGLGLALVRAIADRHGGTVAARSRPGQGSVVALRLPASA
jgi:signal transduction histidine kinase